jgi:hypothetical protein
MKRDELDGDVSDDVLAEKKLSDFFYYVFQFELVAKRRRTYINDVFEIFQIDFVEKRQKLNCPVRLNQNRTRRAANYPL